MFVILGVFVIVAIFLFLERMGIQHTAELFKSPYIPSNDIVTEDVLTRLEKNTLLVVNTKEDNSVLAATQFKQILNDMRVGYEIVDMATQEMPDVREYDTVVILIPDLSPMGEGLIELFDWVKEGGDVLFGVTLQLENYLMAVKSYMGILTEGYTYNMVSNIYIEKDFMLGGGRAYVIDEPYESAWAVVVGKDCEIHAYTEDENHRTPLIWSRKYGRGRIVVDNFGLYTKNLRGLYAASYSLLEEHGVYPVVNGQVYYIDDFPSPVPGGNASYIQDDFNMNIADFYINVWWPDMLKVAEEYGICYTGGVIENYEDDTSGDVERQQDTDRFLYYGNMLLAHGGEISYHGYNHQPLSPKTVNYGGVYSYNVWEDTKAMQNSLTELFTFTEEMFPNVHKSVYIPPSNVLSKEGRTLLAKQGKNVKSIASTYFSADFAYEQEYKVSADGIIEQPRVISGGLIDNFMKLAAFSELNMHYVSSHFLHPDDTLDIDRGADKGWAIILKGYRSYIDWVHQSAPNLRDLTGSQFGAAVERYGILSVKKSYKDSSMILKLENFYDEAYLFLRCNEGIPKSVEGADLEHLTGNLYLIKAKRDTVVIDMAKEDR